MNDPDGHKERYREAKAKKGEKDVLEKHIRKHVWKQKRLLTLGLTEFNRIAGQRSILTPR